MWSVPGTRAILDLSRISRCDAGGRWSGPQFRVSTDQEAGVRLVVEHFLDQGHRRLMHVAGPDDWFDGQVRTQTWRQLVREHGLAEQIIGGANFEPGIGRAAMARWLDAGEEVTDAVFAANDFLAVGVIPALHEHGLRAPGDVAVAGFDNSTDAGFLISRLTSVEQNFGELVEESLELLVGAMTGEQPRTVLIEPELVVRESSVCWPRSGAVAKSISSLLRRWASPRRWVTISRAE